MRGGSVHCVHDAYRGGRGPKGQKSAYEIEVRSLQAIENILIKLSVIVFRAHLTTLYKVVPKDILEVIQEAHGNKREMIARQALSEFFDTIVSVSKVR